MLISVDRLVEILSQKISERNPDAVARRGSVIHDAFVIPSAISLSWNSALLEFTRSLTSLDTILLAKTDPDLQLSVAEAMNLSVNGVLQLLSDSIDRIAANYGLTRKSAQFASGLVHFYANTAPLADITIAAGTEVETAQKVRFTTTAAIVMSVDNLSSFYDPALNAYSVAAPIEAVESGAASNVPANTITIDTAGTLPNGVSGLTNKYELTTGHAAETDEEFVDRIKITLRGTNLETKDGLAALILNNTTVRTIFVADAQSPYQFRNNGKGGVADIYTADTIPAQVSAQLYFTGPAQYIYSGYNSGAYGGPVPVLDIIAVEGELGGVAHTFIEGTDYNFVPDTIHLTQKSAKARDRIEWIVGGDAPDGAYTVTYVYNQAVTSIQALVDSDTYRPLMGKISDSVLAREGILVPIEISYQIVSFGGYSKSQVISDAIVNIQNYVNDLGFGDSVAQSDIINIVENTPGVNYVFTTPLAFNRVGGQISDVITSLDYEYIRASDITLL